MSYTMPNGQPQGTPFHFTNKIREALIAELIAINGYAEHIANSDMQEINKAWKSIMGDELTHYGMFLSLLRKYDPVQYQQYLQHQKEGNGPKDAMQAYKPQYDRQIILNNIREDIKGEYEAVILYEQHLIQMPYQDIKNVFIHVNNEEKGHAEHLTKLMLKYET